MTEKQRHNLEVLAAALATGWTPLEFDMGTYETDCKTVACAAGHAPYATGINRFPDEAWHDYVKRMSGLYEVTPRIFCFGLCWKFFEEPTASQAADRIAWLLDGGEPETRWGAICAQDYENRPWANYFQRSGREFGDWYGLDLIEKEEVL